MKIKNIAIIAHVDHGKTTLVDQLLRNSGIFRDNENLTERVMDSNDLEKERGITILAKNTAVEYGGYHINILDTPGHADFGGEVERILKMVDGVLLVVDAYEGCMPQTRFVLKKAMEQNLKPVVIVNKIDRPQSRSEEVIDEVIDLLIELGATDDQIDFPVVYASAINGQSGHTLDTVTDNMDAMFEAIIEHVEEAENDEQSPLQMQISLLDYNDYVGRIGIGRVSKGTIKVNQQVTLVRNDNTNYNFKVTKLYGFNGLKRIEVDQARAGEIIAVVGCEDINVSETVCELNKPLPLEALHIDEPTLQMEFIVNDSPFAGKEGKYITSSKLEERLFIELKTDVSLRVLKTDSPNKFNVVGRGELHLSILIENMRREGYEFQVAKPQVVIKNIDGVNMEPIEMITIDVPDEYVGGVIESLGNRRGEMIDMKNMNNGTTRLKYKAYSRAIIGYSAEFVTLTKGYGIYNHTFIEYGPLLDVVIRTRSNGALVSMENGKTTAYGLQSLEDRGIMLLDPGVEVYEGMIVGEHSKSNDLAVNAVRQKQLTNVRSANKDSTVNLKKSKDLSLEQSIQFLEDDEYLEVTPESLRLRKKYLKKNERDKQARQLKKQYE